VLGSAQSGPEEEDSLHGNMHQVNRKFQLWSHNASAQHKVIGPASSDQSQSSKQTHDYVRALLLRNHVQVDPQTALHPARLDFAPLFDSQASLTSYQDIKERDRQDRHFEEEDDRTPRQSFVWAKEDVLEESPQIGKLQYRSKVHMPSTYLSSNKKYLPVFSSITQLFKPEKSMRDPKAFAAAQKPRVSPVRERPG